MSESCEAGRSAVRAGGRRSIRLPGYDYAQPGAYFVTVCTYQRVCLLGEVVGGEVALSDYGDIVQRTWDGLPNHYPHVELDAWVIMPNHVHGIVVLKGSVGAGLRPAPTPAPTARRKQVRHGLPEFVRALKSFSARNINQLRTSPGVPVWQRNYYEHVIRNEQALDAIRRYIQNNPARWHLDRYNPYASGLDPQARTLWRLFKTGVVSQEKWD